MISLLCQNHCSCRNSNDLGDKEEIRNIMSQGRAVVSPTQDNMHVQGPLTLLLPWVQFGPGPNLSAYSEHFSEYSPCPPSLFGHCELVLTLLEEKEKAYLIRKILQRWDSLSDALPQVDLSQHLRLCLIRYAHWEYISEIFS